jgi:diguanylate cyclase (GGDEF)-like protein
MVRLAGWCHLPVAIASQHVHHILSSNAQHRWLAPRSAEGNAPETVIPFAERVWQTGQPFVVNNASDHPDFRQLPQVAAFPHLNCYAGVPIVGDRLGNFGVLSVMGYALNQVSADSVDLLELAAHEVVGLLGDRPVYRPSTPTEAVSTVRSYPPLAIAPTSSQRLRLLQQMTSVLQECGSLYKAQPILPEFLQQLFLGTSGQVLMGKHTRKNQAALELMTCWGSLPDACSIEWFDHLRPGFVEQSLTNTPLLEHRGHLYCPMWVNQRMFGLLVLTSDVWQTKGAQIAMSEKQFIQDVAQHLAITLHTLNRIDFLQKETLQDPLTGLYNRRHMMNVLDTMLRRATYGRNLLSIIMLDIDYFKRLNDSFGHPAGDQVLKDLGVFLKGFVRPTDVACRYGGEEFSLILNNTDKPTALRRAERIRQGIAYITMKYQGRSLGSITVSLGVATFPEDGQTVSEVIRAADAALYQAKASGRNRAAAAQQSK